LPCTFDEWVPDLDFFIHGFSVQKHCQTITTLVFGWPHIPHSMVLEKIKAHFFVQPHIPHSSGLPYLMGLLGQNYLRKIGLIIIWAVGVKCKKL
jgi:hypothetical protein